MFLITFFIFNLIVVGLNENNFISEINSISFYLVMGAALLILNINQTESIKRKSSAILIELNLKGYAKWVEEEKK